MSRRKRSFSRDRSCSTGKARVRAAASSMANGSPSRRAQISATVASEVVGGVEPGPAAAARARNSCTASSRGQRGHRPDRLAADPQALTARRQEPQPRAVTQEVLGDLGGRRDDVLAVVEHDRAARVRRSSRPAGPGRAARARRDRGPHGRRVADGRQLDEARAVRQRARTSARATSSASRVLPTPPGPTSVTQAVLRGQPGEVAQLLVAADERGQRRRDRSTAGPTACTVRHRRRAGASSDGSWARIAASNRRSSGPGSSPSSSPRMRRPSW